MSAYLDALAIAVQINRPVFVQGPPGTGKSTSVKQMLEALGYWVELEIGGNKEPQHFGGLPIVDRPERAPTPQFKNPEAVARILAARFQCDPGVALANLDDLVLLARGGRGMPSFTLAPPKWARRLKRKKKGALILDELTTAPGRTQGAMMRVFWERVVGDLKLSPETRMLAIGNDAKKISAGTPLNPPLANRLIHLDAPLNDHRDWGIGMLTGWPKPKVPELPTTWRDDYWSSCMRNVIAFTEAQPHLFHKEPKDDQRHRAWPSKRTWEIAVDVLAAASAMKTLVHPSTRGLLLAGAVGQAAADQYLEYEKTLSLPNPHDVLSNPGAFQFDYSRSDIIHATLAAVIFVVKTEQKQEHWYGAWRLLKRLTTEANLLDIAVISAGRLIPLQPMSAVDPPPEIDFFYEELQAATII